MATSIAVSALAIQCRPMRSMTSTRSNMDAVRSLRIVLNILFVKYLRNDGQGTEAVAHQSVQEHFGYLAALAHLILVSQPEVLSSCYEAAVALVRKCRSFSLRQRRLGYVVPEVTLELGIPPLGILEIVD